MKKFKILFFHNTIAAYRVGFFRELSKISELDICLTDPELNNKVYHSSVIYDDLNVLTLSNITQIKQWMIDLLQRNKYDLVILPTLDTARDAYIGSVICKVSHKFKIQTGYFWEKWMAPKREQPFLKLVKNDLQKQVSKQILRNVDFFWYPGKCTKSYFLQQLDIRHDKLHKIHDSSVIEKKEIQKSIFDNEQIKNKIKILYFGRVIKRKGLKILLKAFSEIDSSNVVLIVAGDGPELEQYKNFAREYKLLNTYFVGAIQPDDRYTYFSQTDIFVLPSTIENGIIEAWGLTLNEAMGCDKYLIASDVVGSAYEIIVNNKNGQVFEHGNVDELRRALLKAIKNYNSPQVTTINKQLQEQYTYSNMAQDILKVLM